MEGGIGPQSGLQAAEILNRGPISGCDPAVIRGIPGSQPPG